MKNVTERICPHCSKKFAPMVQGAGRKYCCPACMRAATEKLKKLYYENKLKIANEKKNGKLSINEIQREAQIAGMSYGKYVLSLNK